MLKKLYLIVLLTCIIYASDSKNIDIPEFGWDIFLKWEMLRQADSREVFKSKKHSMESLVDTLLFDRPRDGRIDFDVIYLNLAESRNLILL